MYGFHQKTQKKLVKTDTVTVAASGCFSLEKSTGEISLKVKTSKTQDHEDFDNLFVVLTPHVWTSNKIKKGYVSKLESYISLFLRSDRICYQISSRQIDTMYVIQCKPSKKIESSNPQNLLPFSMEINILIKGNADIL